MSEELPSKQITRNSLNGKIVHDELGRKLVLKKPSLIEQYDLMSAIGKDADTQSCLFMALNTLCVQSIDDVLLVAPKSQPEFRAALIRLGEEGLAAISQVLQEIPVKSEQEVKQELKNS